MMSTRFEFGDRVRHVRRPEWGIGSVMKVERTAQNGIESQRLSIRFPNVGVKVLNTAQAELERCVAAEREAFTGDENHPPAALYEHVESQNWLAGVAQKKITEAMTSLPPEARDPFASLKRRLEFTLDLYRFDRTGGKLLDWAVAQTGLSDPMTKFNRHELEQLFDRWAHERDLHLVRLLEDARHEQPTVQQALANARPEAQRAVRRLSAVR